MKKLLAALICWVSIVTSKLDLTIVNKLKELNITSKLFDIPICELIGDEQIALTRYVESIVRVFDRDNDGKIDIKEIPLLLKTLTCKVLDPE